MLNHAKGNIPLVFSQSYHSDWKLYQVRSSDNNISYKGSLFETWFSKPLSDNTHYLINGFANSWTIDVDKLCTGPGANLCHKNPAGDYVMEFVIEFQPQRIFILSFFVSIISVLVSFLVVCYLRFKNSYHIALD